MRTTASVTCALTLVAQAVNHAFGIVGSASLDALELFPPAGIRFISTVHGQGAAQLVDESRSITA